MTPAVHAGEPVVVGRIDSARLPEAVWMIETPTACPEPAPSWRLRELYVPKDQPRLCQYIWASPEDNMPADVTWLKQFNPERDPPSLTMLGTEIEDKWFVPLHDLAHKRFNLPAADPMLSVTLPGAPVVAVLDTAAEAGPGIVDPDGHGRGMGGIIQMIACAGQTACSFKPRYYSALPFTKDEHELLLTTHNAGALGTRGDLASQIYRATDDWQANPQGSPLIINLSLGWSGCYESPRDAGSRAVHRALTYATCHGAVVIAAAGNADAVPGCPNNPAYPWRDPKAPLHMYPGLWGGEKVTQEECRQVGVQTKKLSVPLLLGVGAVDYRDQQLSMTDHEADLVAYGQTVSVPFDPPTPMGNWLQFSGTSVSAAATSGMAALALRHAPKLSASELIDKLFSARVNLDRGRPVRDPAAPQPSDAFICNEAYRADCGKSFVGRLSACQLLKNLGRPVRCDVLGAGVPTPSGVKPLTNVTPHPERAVDCSTCGAKCPAACDLSGNGDQDACDSPWNRKQDGGKGCTCNQANATPTSHALLAFMQDRPADAPGLQMAFDEPATSILVIVDLGGGRERRYALGDAEKAGTLYSWKDVDLSGARRAKVVFRASKGPLEVLDVRLREDGPTDQTSGSFVSELLTR